MWCEAGYSPGTFWQQTQRSFVIALAGAAKREIALAWKIAALTASASIGKLPPLDELFGVNQPEASKPKPKSNGKDKVAAELLSFMFKMKSRGVPMQIERIERLH